MARSENRTSRPLAIATVAVALLLAFAIPAVGARRPALKHIYAPSAAHPLVLLKIGDSLGEELGFGLSDLIGRDQHVTILQDAVGDSGLARPDFYNWPLHLREELARYHPQAVIVLLGGDDAQNFINDGEYITFGTSKWHAVYSQRVATMMREATSAGAHVIWVGLPIMASSYFSEEMQKENAIYANEARHFPGVTFIPTWKLFANRFGHYSAYLPGPNGQLELMRNSDGVHFSGAGADRLASAVVSAMDRTWHIRLAPRA